jgi:hypothetical protein
VVDRTPSALADPTEIGSYFVATYPPFSAWTSAAVAADGRPALETSPAPGVPLGLYLHIPFCRKRCHFCYFRVYTDKNAQEVADYLDVLAHEWELYAGRPSIAGRPLNFVYFGGGTPSFLSTKQLEGLVSRLDAVTSWRNAEEVTFECEPGTLTEASRHRRDEAESRRRELQRRDPRRQWPGAPVAGNRPGLCVRAIVGVSSDQHRPHCRHARGDRR